MAWMYRTVQSLDPQTNGRELRLYFWFHKVQWKLKTSNVEIHGVDLDPKLV